MAGSGRAVLVDARSRMMSGGRATSWKGLSFGSEFFLFFLGFRMVRAPGEACRFPSSCQKRGRPMGTGRQCLGGHPDELYQHPSGFHAEPIGGGSGCTVRGD
jgi:hypothetical protein